jgi:hypothetical protein
MKTSIEYAELTGLLIAVSNLETFRQPNTQVVVDWMKVRIKELEKK